MPYDFGLPVTVPLPDFPFGPVAFPVCVTVPFEFFVVVPEAVVVPPLGPVTVPCSVAPDFVAVAEPCALTVFPLALVAVAVPETVLPVCDALPVTAPPRFVVTVFCACAAADNNPHTKVKIATIFKFFISFSLNRFELPPSIPRNPRKVATTSKHSREQPGTDISILRCGHRTKRDRLRSTPSTPEDLPIRNPTQTPASP